MFSVQFAFSTRVGADCVGHAIRAATGADHEATVLSIDGVGAWGIFSYTPEPHIAFCPIFPCLNPMFKNGPFLSVVDPDNHHSPCLC